MQAIQIRSFGDPARVARCVELPDPGPPGPGEAVIAVEACPINPADLLTLRGEYGALPTLPAIIGAEGVGRVQQTGADVTQVRPGDRVLLPLGGPGTWRSLITLRAQELLVLPAEADAGQLAMLAVNPPTAYLLLHSMVTLSPGDWLVQNTANSGVGRLIVRLARRTGLRTLNVVRRAGLESDLRALGADAVLEDGNDLAERARAATGNAALPLALDAVGGSASGRLAACLADGGTLVCYGRMSGQACRIPARELIFRDLTVRGFWLGRWLRQAPADRRTALYRELSDGVVSGDLATPVAARYPLPRIREAVAHAQQAARHGKVLLVPELAERPATDVRPTR